MLPAHEKKITSEFILSQTLVLEGSSRPVLPMEAFRSGVLAKQENWHKIFLSSGTTSGPSGRSQSPFSKEGLARYRTSVLKVFATYIPSHTHVISLIPPPAVWPESSLAQMVAWIGEEYPLQYFEPEISLDNALIFATAWHLVELARTSTEIPITAQILQTGGTKGKTKDYTTEEFADLLKKRWNIPKSRVLSEYSMCELACQAYSCSSGDPYRFDKSVELKILDEKMRLAESGEGILCIYDPARIDFPFFIQTEDLVDLREDGAFFLKGRVPSAPLRGCSLHVAA